MTKVNDSCCSEKVRLRMVKGSRVKKRRETDEREEKGQNRGNYYERKVQSRLFEKVRYR